MKNLVLSPEQWLHHGGRRVRRGAIPFATSPTGRSLFRFEDTYANPQDWEFQKRMKKEVDSWPVWKQKAASSAFMEPIPGPGESVIPFPLPERYVPHSDATRSFLEHLDSLTPQAQALREIEARMDDVFYKHHGDALGGDICDGYFDEP